MPRRRRQEQHPGGGRVKVRTHGASPPCRRVPTSSEPKLAEGDDAHDSASNGFGYDVAAAAVVARDAGKTCPVPAAGEATLAGVCEDAASRTAASAA